MNTALIKGTPATGQHYKGVNIPKQNRKIDLYKGKVMQNITFVFGVAEVTAHIPVQLSVISQVADRGCAI